MATGAAEARHRVLVVEDDADARAAYAAFLASEGFAVDLAGDGMEALFKAKAQPPDLVLLDLALPNLDGFYVAELWRADEEMRQKPIIAISGFLDAHNERRAREAGCTRTLAKPFSPQELRQAIQGVLPGSVTT